MKCTRKQISEMLAKYYADKFKRDTGQEYAGKVWVYFDESKRAYCLRGEGLPAHPDLRDMYPNGWSLLDYVKPTEARALVARL